MNIYLNSILKTLASLLSAAVLLSGCSGSEGTPDPEESAEDPPVQTAADRSVINGVLKIGIPADSGISDGFCSELADDAAKWFGTETELVPYGWQELADNLSAGRLDIALDSISVPDEWRSQLLVSDCCLESGMTVICRAEDADKFFSLKSINLPEVRVATAAGGAEESFAKKELPACTLTVHSSEKEIPGLIADGAADVMITGTAEAGHYVGADSRLAAPLIWSPFTEKKLGFLVPENDPGLLSALNGFISAEKESGRIAELTDKYIYAGLLPDYSDRGNWAYFGEGQDRDADLFLVCPTVDTKAEFNMRLDDEDMKKKFLRALNMERGIYEDCTRMYAPYYRQTAMKIFDLTPEERDVFMEKAYRDVSAAFRSYLENENGGRPVILAGFSQGASMCYRLLEDYFGDEELYGRLAAVYAIGYPCSPEMTEKYPQFRAAQSADDTGVIITFDCEAPEVTETFLNPAGGKSICINPLTWSTDPSPADKLLNPGACFTNGDGDITKEIPGLCGCYIDSERGVLKVTDIEIADYPPGLPLLPEGGYHLYDYQFFYRSLRQNVAVRLKAYFTAAGSEAA